jgi:hypothetical protein
LFERLKDLGDDVAHDNRDTLTVSEVEKLLKNPDFDESAIGPSDAVVRYFFQELQELDCTSAAPVCPVTLI